MQGGAGISSPGAAPSLAGPHSLYGRAEFLARAERRERAMQWNQIPKIPVTPKRTTAATPRKPTTLLRARRIMVPVVDRNGKRLGEVPQSTTSVGAGKIAGGEVVFSRRLGYYAWIKE